MMRKINQIRIVSQNVKESQRCKQIYGVWESPNEYSVYLAHMIEGEHAKK